MQRFFFDGEHTGEKSFSVSGEKYNHICRVLRMSVGEKAVFCDGAGTDYICTLSAVSSESAVFTVDERHKNENEPEIKITVFQCVPKNDKMDDLVKRCVQFGACEIVPVLSKRCVSRPDKKSGKKKVERLQKIALSSAMQSMRGVIPAVSDIMDFKPAVDKMATFDTAFICYEDEKKTVFDKDMIHGNTLAFLIGPEGGLTDDEVRYAQSCGIIPISLGKRILRTEDAAPFFIPILLYSTGNLD